MTLKTRFLLIASVTMVAVLILSEWLTYREVAAFLAAHRSAMQGFGNAAASVEALEEGTRGLLMRFVWLHVAVAGLSLGTMALVLHVAWGRAVRRRLDRLAARIAKMERGTWDLGDVKDGGDEIAALEQRIAQLGRTVTVTAEQFGDVSKLAALALLGHSISRDVAEASIELRAAIEELDRAAAGSAERLRPAADALEAVLESLEQIPLRLQQLFEREFEKHAAPGREPSAG